MFNVYIYAYVTETDVNELGVKMDDESMCYLLHADDTESVNNDYRTYIVSIIIIDTISSIITL